MNCIKTYPARKIALALSRRHFMTGGGAVLACLAMPGPLMAALADMPQRALKLNHARTGENLNLTYYENGDYVPDALDEIDYFLRDERAPEMAVMDRKLIDLLSTIQQRLETNEPLLITSGYRTKKTNQMLAERGRRVARKSFHIYGQATDFQVHGRSVRKIGALARSLQGGGVGQYRNFIHVDTGPVRKW